MNAQEKFEQELKKSISASRHHVRDMMVDPYLFTHIGRALTCLLTPPSSLAAPALKSAAQDFYEADHSRGHAVFWESLAIGITRVFRCSDPSILEQTQGFLAQLLMATEDRAPTQTFSTLAHSHLIQRACYVLKKELLPAEVMGPPPVLTRENGLDILLDNRPASRLLKCSVPPFAGVSQLFIDLAYFKRHDANPLKKYQNQLDWCFKTGFPSRFIKEYFISALDWKKEGRAQKEKMASHLFIAVLNSFTEHHSSYLKAVQEELERRPDVLALFSSEETLKLFYTSLGASVKDHLFAVYRRLQAASSVGFVLIAAATVYLTAYFWKTGHPPSFLPSFLRVAEGEPHAENYNYALSALEISLAAALTYRARSARGSQSQRELEQRLREHMQIVPTRTQQFIHQRRNFYLTAAATSVLLGLNLQSTLYEWMGGVIGEPQYSTQAMIALVVFTIAAVSLVGLGPWAVELFCLSGQGQSVPPVSSALENEPLLSPLPWRMQSSGRGRSRARVEEIEMSALSQK